MEKIEATDSVAESLLVTFVVLLLYNVTEAKENPFSLFYLLNAQETNFLSHPRHSITKE
jgi:hypothetical protein